MVKLTEDMVVARSKGSDLCNIKKLNCWGSELSDVAVVRKLQNVEVLSLSVNQISTLEDFQYCSHLQELYIRKNNIGDINEVLYLRQLPKLKSLWLSDNPCANFEQYRYTVLRTLPHLQKLDNAFVEPEEVQKALVYGLVLPLPDSNLKSTESEGLTHSSSVPDSLKSESGSDVSPSSNLQQVPRSNGYNQSLEEGYEYTQNLYDEDDEQPPIRRTNYTPKQEPPEQPYERRTSQSNYSVQGRNRYPDGYRHSYADYEDDRSSISSSHQNQYTSGSRRQSYAGCPPNRQPLQKQTPPHRMSQMEQEPDPRPYSRSSSEYVYDSRNANFVNKEDTIPRYTSTPPCTVTKSPVEVNENNKNTLNTVHRRPRDTYREQSWASDPDCFPRGVDMHSRHEDTYSRHGGYGPPDYNEGRHSDFRTPPTETRPYSSRGTSGAALQQQYENIYRRVDQQIETASARTNMERPSPTRPYPIRPKTRNANVLSAVLCLIKELDYSNLEVVEMAIRCRMEEMED